MPYISKKRREELVSHSPYNQEPPRTAGELNYLITMLMQSYIRESFLCYKTINDAIGALEGAKLEFYRRVAAPYEDQKIKENGDVY